MIKEEYVSFEVAKLLKEKGFNEKCSRWYVANEPQEGLVVSGFGENQFYINAPTQQMAMMWLREEKMIFILLFPTFKSSPSFKSRLLYSWCVNIKNCFGEELGGNYEYITYEEAVEAALKYVLENLI